MENAAYIIMSRMSAQLRATAVVANNIAGADTPGFRASRPVFTEQLERARAPRLPQGMRELHFASSPATWRDTDQGPIRQTGNPLDLAITGQGYFVVATAQGERYTRAGRFSLSAAGDIVDMGGNQLLGVGNRPIRVPPGETDLTIAADGVITGRNGEIGRLTLVRFENEQSLEAQGDRLFAAPPDATPIQLDAPRLVQGAVEGANVNTITEMVRLTEEQRFFQIAVRFAEAENERKTNSVDRLLRRR